MKLQRELEREVHRYVEETLYQNVKEKLLWNEGGELYSIVATDGTEKSLFATSLEGEKYRLKELYKKIAEDSKSNGNYIFKCEKIACKEIVSENTFGSDSDNASGSASDKGCYIFMILEKLTPLIQLVLEEKFCDENLNSNKKLIKVLSSIVGACKSINYITEKYPEINIFINNEELCVDRQGNTKLLLLDMVKNDICIDNQTGEMRLMLKQIAKGVGVEIELSFENNNISDIESACQEQIEELEKIEENYRIGFDQCARLAEKSNPIAWYNLGYMYETGKGTSTDYNEAIKWYKKAASKKHVKALNNLARIYQKGLGVDKDYKIAMEYLLKAAKQNDDVAQFNLGIIYQTGKGVEKDMKTALYWYKKAMKNGNKTARRMYMRIKNK